MLGISGPSDGYPTTPTAQELAENAARRQAARRIRMHIRKILAKIRRLLQQAAHMTSREFYNNLAYMSQYRPGQYMPPN